MKTTIFLIITIISSGSAMIPDQEAVRGDLREKKLALLEKLESGKHIESEEIWSSFRDSKENDFFMPEDFPVLFSHEDMEKFNESVRYNMESIKREISNLKNSEEFKKAMDEIRKGSEEIRRELEKIREEIRLSDRRSSEWENG